MFAAHSHCQRRQSELLELVKMREGGRGGNSRGLKSASAKPSPGPNHVEGKENLLGKRKRVGGSKGGDKSAQLPLKAALNKRPKDSPKEGPSKGPKIDLNLGDKQAVVTVLDYSFLNGSGKCALFFEPLENTHEYLEGEEISCPSEIFLKGFFNGHMKTKVVNSWKFQHAHNSWMYMVKTRSDSRWMHLVTSNETYQNFMSQFVVEQLIHKDFQSRSLRLTILNFQECLLSPCIGRGDKRMIQPKPYTEVEEASLSKRRRKRFIVEDEEDD